MQWTAYATRCPTLSASGSDVITSPSRVWRASRPPPTTRMSTSRSVKMPTSRPSASTISTPACRRVSMRSMASLTVAVSRRQMGSAGPSARIMSSSAWAIASSARASTSAASMSSPSASKSSKSGIACYLTAATVSIPRIPLFHQRGRSPRRYLPIPVAAQHRPKLIARVARVLQHLHEALGGRRERLVSAMHDADRAYEARNAHVHCGQRADGGLLLHGVARKDADAGGDDDRLLDRLDVVELHHDVQAYVVLPERPIDRL